MKALIKATLKAPLTRTSAVITAYLTGQGIPQTQAEAVAAGLVTGVFVVIDLIYARKSR